MTNDHILSFCILSQALDAALKGAQNRISNPHRALEHIEDTLGDDLLTWLSARIGVSAYDVRDAWEAAQEQHIDLAKQAAALEAALRAQRAKRQRHDHD